MDARGRHDDEAGCRRQPARPARGIRSRGARPHARLAPGHRAGRRPVRRDRRRAHGARGRAAAAAPGDGGWVSPLPFALEVVAFSDEEGTRFGKALLGSSAVAGTWDDEWWDADGCRRHDPPRGVPRVRPRPGPHRRGRPATRRARRLPRGAHRAGTRARPPRRVARRRLVDRERAAVPARDRGRGPPRGRHAVRHAPRRPARRERGGARGRAHLPRRAPRHRHGRAARGLPRRGQHRARRSAPEPRPARRVRRLARPRLGRDRRARSTASWDAAACAGTRARSTTPPP